MAVLRLKFLSKPDIGSNLSKYIDEFSTVIKKFLFNSSIGVLLYAHAFVCTNKSPYASLRSGCRGWKPSSSLNASTNVLHSHSPTVETTTPTEVPNPENNGHNNIS